MSTSSVPAEPQHDSIPTPPPARRRRRWWLNGKLWIAVIGTILGAAGTLAVNEAVAWAFPGTDRAGRLANAVQQLAGEMRVNRDGVALLTEQLRDAHPGSPQATEIAVRLEASATALVQTSDQLNARVAAFAANSATAPPSTRPQAKDPASPASPAARSLSEVADSTPQSDLWLSTSQSTLIGTARNAFGVQYWSAGRVRVALNGGLEWLGAGDRMQYPDAAQDCYIVYLRTNDPDPAKNGDERHGFALTCGPKATPAP